MVTRPRSDSDSHEQRTGTTPAGASGPGLLLSIVLFCSQSEVRPLEVLEELLGWIDQQDRPCELVIALDGDRADLYRRFQERVGKIDWIKLVMLNTRQGQLATIRAGIAVSSGRYVVTFPAYPQVDPASIPSVIEQLDRGADYVVGYRETRKDSIFNRVASRFFNLLIQKATGLRFRDIACGMHGFARGRLTLVPDYGDNQVFLPILAAREGLKVTEVAVIQNPSEPRLRVFSPGIYIRRTMSLITLAFLVRFTQKPLYPFGTLGAVLFLSGLVLSIILVYQRFFGEQPMAERPMLLLALLLLTAGIQVVILGLLGELLIYLHFRDQATYHLEERTGRDGEEE